MFTQPGGYGAPTLESYSIEAATPKSNLLQEAISPNRPQFQLTLHGGNFIERAMMLIIKIGDIWVQNYQIVDERTIMCYLNELPEEGAKISISYSGLQQTELPEAFSRSKLSEQ